MKYKVLELYSGIGGMHCAWNESGIEGEIAAAVDINTVANTVYKYNFPKTCLLNKNIQSVSVTDISKFDVNVVLMSPPCQPFTRNGNQLDTKDARSNSFIYFLDILNKLNSVNYILLENVKGFETSAARDLFLERLSKNNFIWQEFLLNPLQLGVPNSRLRYYCIARRGCTAFSFRSDSIQIQLPNIEEKEPFAIDEILEKQIDSKFLIPQKMLKRARVLDICYRDSKRSCCFTKAYTHFIHGMGSVYTDCTSKDVEELRKRAGEFDLASEEYTEVLQPLQLRFFTPREVASLMSFPDSHEFPQGTTMKQKYRLLGNSINVKVVSELIKLLMSYFFFIYSTNI